MGKKELPDSLKLYDFHGVNLEYREGNLRCGGECPWCGDTEKFRVNVEKGVGQCFRCGGFNQATFIERLWKESLKTTTTADYKRLATERGLVRTSTLKRWGVVKSAISSKWLIPGHTYSKKQGSCVLANLYKYESKCFSSPLVFDDGSHRLRTCLFGRKLYRKSNQVVVLVEGAWDAMALDEVFRSHSVPYTVVATPGCKIFKEEWLRLFKGKEVWVLFDNDHPTKHNPEPAALAGIKKVANALYGTASDVRYLDWSAKGNQWNPELSSGYDIRDYLTSKKTTIRRLDKFNELSDDIRSVPNEWVDPNDKTSNKETVNPLNCKSYRALTMSWKRALKWTDGLDYALSVMLASVVSTKMQGDQLWLKVIGPASCGKSTLCEALSTNLTHVIPKSTIRGFHSGYGDGSQDNSLIDRLRGKTLVTKDGDTLLQTPNLGQILAEARDIYDGTSRAHYRNRVQNDYNGIRMTWILCGTNSLRSIDSSELGERFLDCVIMDRIDQDMEREIAIRKAIKAWQSVNVEANGKPESQQEPELTKAMAMTGGYINHLKETAIETLNGMGDITEEFAEYIYWLAKLVAVMRARPSKMQDESVEREVSTRLTSQLIRLSKCLAVVLNRDVNDELVTERVARVALDTSRGPTLEICKHLYAFDDGVSNESIHVLTGLNRSKVSGLLSFLRKIGAVRCVKKDNKKVWKLDPTTVEMLEAVDNDAKVLL